MPESDGDRQTERQNPSPLTNRLGKQTAGHRQVREFAYPHEQTSDERVHRSRSIFVGRLRGDIVSRQRLASGRLCGGRRSVGSRSGRVWCTGVSRILEIAGRSTGKSIRHGVGLTRLRFALMDVPENATFGTCEIWSETMSRRAGSIWRFGLPARRCLSAFRTCFSALVGRFGSFV